MTPWTAIIPVRSFADGKSRLQGVPTDTAALTAAFLTDLINAGRTCPDIDEVIVVSPDPIVQRHASDLGARALPDGSTTGINGAIEVAREQLPPGAPVAAILGDTPCLGADELTAVLTDAAHHSTSFVPDTAGTGSTIWCSSDATSRSHFGHHSRAEHRLAGAVELGANRTDTTWARARRDVDTAVDLWDAIRLGVGPATAALT